MSLVVGEIHDGGVSLVADTKITTLHDTRTRHVFENALPKLVILREDLCVGFAGNDPESVIATLVAERRRSVEDIRSIAVSMPHASFVIAQLGKAPALWQVNAGNIEDRTSIGRAWAGDHAGYEIFQAKYNEWPPGMDPGFLLLSSLQWLLTWNLVPSIGGYHTRVQTTLEGFRFAADTTIIGPEEMHGLVTQTTDGSLNLELSPLPDGDQSTLALQCAVGEPPTFGALAYLVAPLGLAILFPQAAPGAPIIFPARTMAELIHRAGTVHGQHLTGSI